ncbi:MAG TPA: hypothetical protein VN213_17150 [Solirubrobacteraceae bacterium]|nr:hypothetical protein [Solirubrobacteraceae bacterium]
MSPSTSVPGARLTPSGVVWNTVVPALGVALVAGAPMLVAFAIAAAAALAIAAAMAGARFHA